MNDNNDIKDGWREELEDYFVIKGMYTTYETIQCNLRVDLVVNVHCKLYGSHTYFKKGIIDALKRRENKIQNAQLKYKSQKKMWKTKIATKNKSNK